MNTQLLTISFLLILISSCVSFSQGIEEKLVGNWTVNTTNEFSDLIIFRSDHHYYVYNSSSVATESLGLTEDLKSDDILINGAYTSMTEKGQWHYESTTEEIVLSSRTPLEKTYDFAQIYGSSDTLRFRLSHLSEDTMKICFIRQGGQVCDEYINNWSYITNDSIKVRYHEINKTYTNQGKAHEELLLSGYETELDLTYQSQGAGQLILKDRKGRELFSTELKASNKQVEKHIPLRGVTQLVMEVQPIDSATEWTVNVDIK